jgi:hypothetical protein
MLQSVFRLILTCALPLAPTAVFAASGAPVRSVPLPRQAESDPGRYFDSPYIAIKVAQALLRTQDWKELSRYYDLSLTPEIKRSELLEGSFFIKFTAPRSGPQSITRWLHPVPPGATIVAVKPLGEPDRLPCIWLVTTMVLVPQEKGPDVPVTRECQMIQTSEGFRFLPPTPLGGIAPKPVAGDAGTGEKAILAFRPSLRARLNREVPEERVSNIPQLVEAVERLRQEIEAQRHMARVAGKNPISGSRLPTDDELLLSLAGDRLSRVVQAAPPGTLSKLRADTPTFKAAYLEYQHIEFNTDEDAPESLRFSSLPPVTRRVELVERKP